MLWVAFAVMTAAAVLCIVWPLSKPGRISVVPPGDDVGFYREQLRALDLDIEAGLVPAGEAAGSRAEIGRRLLAADERRAAGSPASIGSDRRRLFAIAATVIVVIPAVSLGVYLRLGAPDTPDMPLASRSDAPQDNQIADAIAKVERHLVSHPQDGRGFEVLAPLFLRLGRYDEAAHAFERALALLGETGARRAGYGQALMLAADGVVTAEARKAFEQAAADDPSLPQPRFYLGVAAAEDGDKVKARTIWTSLMSAAPSDAPWLPLVKARLTALDRAAPPARAEGPASPAGAAIAALPTGAQMTAIRGMVDGLAARLAQDGADKDGWLKLVRAYAVLGERDRALGALADGRRNLSTDPQALADLKGLAHELGLES